MYSFRQISATKFKNTSQCWNILSSFGFSTSSTATTSNEQIEIPNRVHRGPTDILKALSSTVAKDPTAAHYKYHDDPYLIPMTNITKRTYAMAQESGRKAARWIKQEHRDLFQVGFLFLFFIL